MFFSLTFMNKYFKTIKLSRCLTRVNKDIKIKINDIIIDSRSFSEIKLPVYPLLQKHSYF